MNLKQTILDNTDNGLDIIYFYYPQAREVVEKRAKHFKLRDEKTASASIYEDSKKTWKVTDFGGDQVARNCFEVAMNEENKQFSEILHLLIQRHNINIGLDEKVNRPKNFKSWDAKPDEKNGSFSAKKKTKLSESDIAVIGPHVTAEILDVYGFSMLESYQWTSNGKTYEITSSDEYPVMMLECEYKVGSETRKFTKIVKPLEPNNASRFYYNGEKPNNHVFGLDLLRDKFSKMKAAEELKENPDRKKKLPEVIIASGERDALNVASMGYNVIWFNSETSSELDRIIYELYQKCERVYNIPDIDATGIRVGTEKALKHLDIYTVWLPSSITQYKDRRGKPRKDLRDYMELHPSRTEFAKLLEISACARFWEFEKHAKGVRESIITANLLYYLRLNGFYKMEDKVAKDITHLIRLQGYKVQIYTAKKIRDFVREDLISRKVSTSVLNLFLNSQRTKASLMDDLSSICISFDKFTPTSRKFFFANAAVNVDADNIEVTKIKDINKNLGNSYCWVDNISPIEFNRTDKCFSVAAGESHDNWNINIHNIRSNYFKFLINTSRIYWREEYEFRAIDDTLANKVYRHENKFNIAGSRLTAVEQQEQANNLVNKIYIIGYLLHRYKIANQAHAIWVMENKITKESESNGGSGKSLMIRMLQSLQLLEIETLNGRSKKMTENNFVLDRISTSTDILNIDDANLNLDFDYFFSMITGSTTINPKGSKSFEISFHDSPNIVFTSNFPPRDFSGSQSRRILYSVFSDYYHAKANNSDNNDYNETFQPSDDLGITLAGHDYTNDMYNDDVNFCIDCLQFYLSCLKNKVKPIAPPMENVRKRLNLSSMGQYFHEWAELYFAEDGENVNKLIKRDDMYNNFLSETQLKKGMTSQTFKKKLEAFVANTDYLAAINPPDTEYYKLDSRNRIIKKDDVGSAKEWLFVQTVRHASQTTRQLKADFNDECPY